MQISRTCRFVDDRRLGRRIGSVTIGLRPEPTPVTQSPMCRGGSFRPTVNACQPPERTAARGEFRAPNVARTGHRAEAETGGLMEQSVIDRRSYCAGVKAAFLRQGAAANGGSWRPTPDKHNEYISPFILL